MPDSQSATDVGLSAFSDRAPLSAAWTWLDRQPGQSTPDGVPLAEAAGRVLAAPVTINPNTPNRNMPNPNGGEPKRAAKNGYAVRAADCDGAGDYNPLALPLMPPGADTLPPGHASPIASGLPLPSGADAVLPLEAAQLADASTLQVMAPVAPGTAVEPPWSMGHIVLDQGQRIGPKEIACLAAMNVERLTVLSRPRVALVVPGAKYGADALTAMLSALLARDGALAQPVPVASGDEEALTAALTSVGDCAFALIAGRAGYGPDDAAAGALKAAGGTLVMHGLALRPGEVTGLGTMQRGGRAVPVVLLPGEPVACLAAYDMVAARLTRRFAGAGTDLPYPVAEFELGRKIVSGIGVVEIVPVCLNGGRAMPVGAGAGLLATVQADGFVVVPETSEGYKETARVRVHLYDTRSAEAAPNIGPTTLVNEPRSMTRGP
jgi:molybdopterin molybdotransferase